MIRLLVLLVLIALLAWSGQWLVAHPGSLAFDWLGYRIETSVVVGVVALLLIALTISLVWGLVSFLFRLPRRMSLASRIRRRERGYEALSRGLIAVGSGDARAARREAAEAGRLIRHDPMTLLLRAQAAQLSGDGATARALFQEMAQRPDTKLLGLRGLYVEARRAGENDAAFAFAEEAQKLSPVAWAGQALIERHAAESRWAQALEALERSGAAGQIDKAELTRGRAALKLAMARELEETQTEKARALAAEALAARPDLAPAAALVSKLHGRRGDYKKATKIVEQAWGVAPHPDLAQAYVDVRPGDSNADRLTRARKLARLKADEPEGRLALAAVAIAAREFGEARAALAPLVEGDSRPTARVCAAMAHLEEAEGHDAKAREWWGRAARAPRDKAWMADGLISETWEPVTPSGDLGGYEWRAPDERHAPALDLPASIFEPAPAEPMAALAAEPAPGRAANGKGRDAASAPSAAEAKADARNEIRAEAKAAAKAVEQAKSEPVKSENAKTDHAEPDLAKIDLAKPDLAKLDHAKADPGRVEQVKAADGKRETHPARPEPVVFPLPKAPDDPGVRP